MTSPVCRSVSNNYAENTVDEWFKKRNPDQRRDAYLHLLTFRFNSKAIEQRKENLNVFLAIQGENIKQIHKSKATF